MSQVSSKKIDKLTPEQEKDLVEFREQWLAKGMSTEPADFPRAEAAIAEFYARLKMAKPEFVRVASPRAAAVEIAKRSGKKKVNTDEYVNGSFFGQQDSYWIAYYLFAERIGVDFGDNSKLLRLWADISESVNWWTPFEGVCFLVDRPMVTKMDNEGRLHREDGPAVEYRDGWGVYSWHGTRVPGEWIDNRKSLTAKIALTWENVEQRRAACEILGWVNVLEELKAKTIDRDEDPEIGELLEVEIPEIGRERFLKVLCGTGRTFALPVPPNMKTALEAQAWTYGVEDVRDFLKPEIRT